MRLCAAAIVRNEADIIEAFVRHNLAFVDRLVVVDHGSTDGTAEILLALAQEGLPVSIGHDPRIGYFQPEVATQLVRDLLQRDRADFVFVLDADEFLRAASRDACEALLRKVPAGMHALLPWVTYIPDFGLTECEDPIALLRSSKRLPAERDALYKVVVSRRFLDTPDAFVAMGNHRVYSSSDAPNDPCPHARLPSEAIAVAHVPIRSADQLAGKIGLGWLAHLAAMRGNPALAFHWGEAYAKLAAGGRFTLADLNAMAANYNIPSAQWIPPDPSTWIDEPVLGPIELRYTQLAKCGALAAVLRFAERLVRERRST
jgi:hypothetical protein